MSTMHWLTILMPCLLESPGPLAHVSDEDSLSDFNWLFMKPQSVILRCSENYIMLTSLICRANRY